MFVERRVNSPLSKPYDASGEETQAILRRLSKIAVAKQALPQPSFWAALILICILQPFSVKNLDK